VVGVGGHRGDGTAGRGGLSARSAPRSGLTDRFS
jgi:hypothetical protein